jgi:hypothetical protein
MDGMVATVMLLPLLTLTMVMNFYTSIFTSLVPTKSYPIEISYQQDNMFMMMKSQIKKEKKNRKSKLEKKQLLP